MLTLARLRRIGRHRFRAIFRKEAVDAEVADELEFHFDALVAEQIAAGVSPEEARCAARRAIGNTAVFEEQCRDHRRVTWLHDLRQDAGYAVRTLRASPGFTLVAVVSLALGIGSTAAVIAAFDTVVRQPLHFPDAERLVVVRTAPRSNVPVFGPASLPDYIAWREQVQAFDQIGASIADTRDFLSDGALVTERIAGQLVTPSLFATLGATPLLGRVLTDDDVRGGVAAPVIVISYSFWRDRFGGDSSIVGRTVRVNRSENTVVGVMGPDFSFPDRRPRYWAPLGYSSPQQQGSARFFQVTARLRRGVTATQADQELAIVVERLARTFPQRHQDLIVSSMSLRLFLLGWTVQPLQIFGAAVGLVLLLACTNVAGLLLARSVARAPELAMRTALGAPRGRLIRQLLAEALVLSTLGAAASVVVTVLWIASIPAWAATGMNRPLELTPDLRVLAIIVGLTIVAAVGAGVVPALWATRPTLVAAFKGAGLQSPSTARSSALRDALVAAQIAIAVVLLVGSALLQTSLLRLLSRDLNFDPSGLITFEYRLLPGEYMKPIGSHAGFPYYEIVRSPALIFQPALDRINALPGVYSAAAISHPVLQTLILPRVVLLIEGRAAPRDEVERAAVTSTHFIVTPGLFATLQTPLVSGRDFDDRDTHAAQWVAIVNEAAARQFWPGGDPIGKRLTLDVVPEERRREVVGVVRDVPLRRAETEAQPIVYTSYLQQPSRYRGPFGNMLGQMTFVVRGSGDLMALGSTFQRALGTLDPDRPVSNIASIEQDLDRSLLTRRLYLRVIGFFAAAATLLAAVGTYGVVAYTVGQRSREIGIRRALGANVGGVVALVGQRAIRLVVAGMAVGVALAMAFTQLLRAQLFGVTPQDPIIYAGVCTLLALVGLAACALPLRRALAIDPMTALREQ